MRATAAALFAGLAGLADLAGASVLTPPVLPLIVRNPYLNVHLTNARDVPWSTWPIFWTGQGIGLSVLAAVKDSDASDDKLVYPLLGRPHDSLDHESDDYNISYATYLGASYDSSTTNLSYAIPPPKSSSSKPLKLTLSFVSPITPTSTLRQSLPASYINVVVDGDFDIDVYLDINGLWVTAEHGVDIEWKIYDLESDNTPSLKTWRVNRRQELKFAEVDDRAEYGRLLFTAPSDVTYEAGNSAKLRHGFALKAQLQNHVDPDFRPVMSDEPVFAFHKRFPGRGANSSAVASSLFTIAHVRDEVAQFASARGLTEMRPLYASFLDTDVALINYHYTDFKSALKLAAEFDAKVYKDAYKTGGQDHIDILALSGRQVLGACDFTGTPEQPLLFMKEISSDGNAQTIDVIFPAFPFFAYANPKWLVYTLDPLIEHMLSGQYPNKYAMHDLGARYPNLTGHPDGRDEYMPVEESGDMLIMALSLVHQLTQQTTDAFRDLAGVFAAVGVQEADSWPLRLAVVDGVGNIDAVSSELEALSFAKAWIQRSYRLWKQWTEYLVEFSLEPQNQLSTDDFAGWLPLQTNLALKGIVGIKAMGELAKVVGNKDEVKYYQVRRRKVWLTQNISDTYIKKWEVFGTSRDGSHAKLAYNWYGSWTLFADALLCFNAEPSQSLASYGSAPQYPLAAGKNSSHAFIKPPIFTKQSEFYTLVLQKYGLPLDARHLYTKSDWQFQAAAAASPLLRAAIVQRIAKWLNETDTTTPFTDLYDTEGNGGYGAGNRFTARPVVGSHYSILVLDRACGGHALSSLAGSWSGSEEVNLQAGEAAVSRWGFVDATPPA